MFQEKEIEQRCEDFFGKLNARIEASVDKKLAEFGFQRDAEVVKMKQEVAKEIGKLSDEVNSIKATVDMQLSANASDIKALNAKMSELIEGQEQEDGDSRPVTFAEMVNKQVEKKNDRRTRRGARSAKDNDRNQRICHGRKR